ncbi:MAG TPA: hypothetical protein VMY87_09925, partial [Armatimonadota bacterium]|nr:hypothetical protein [Armatimonadota bacterium]
RVRVFRSSGQTRRQVGPELTYRHRAKMASAADVDGDGRLDLLVLVWKTTRYDPRPGWRPFVYTLRDSEWTPKWLGSRVGHPLLEAAFVRTPEGVRLLTIEDFGNGRTGFTLYHWRGFGFWGEWTGPAEPTYSDLRVADEDGDGIDEVSVSRERRRALYRYRDGGYASAASTEGRK